MIIGFRDEWLRAFFIDEKPGKQLPADIRGRLFRKLQMLDDATTDADMRVPAGNHFEKLRAIWKVGTPSESTNNGGWCFIGTACVEKQPAFTWTIIPTDRTPICF